MSVPVNLRLSIDFFQVYLNVYAVEREALCHDFIYISITLGELWLTKIHAVDYTYLPCIPTTNPSQSKLKFKLIQKLV